MNSQQLAEQEEDIKEVLIDLTICNHSSLLIFGSLIVYVLFKNYVYKQMHKLSVIEFNGDLYRITSIIVLKLECSLSDFQV